jgi:hypothetical protein
LLHSQVLLESAITLGSFPISQNKVRPYSLHFRTTIMATNEEDGGFFSASPFVGNQRARPKDTKVVKKASVREQSEKRPWNVLPVDNNICSGTTFVSGGPHEIITPRRLGPYLEVWQDKHQAMIDLYTKAHAQLFDESAVRRVCNLATELIESMAATLIEIEIYGFIPRQLFPAYCLRCQLLTYQFQDYRGAIEDASDVLALYHNSAKAFRAEHCLLGTKVQLLWMRALSRARLAGFGGREVTLSDDDVVEELEHSIADYKACCAAIRLAGAAYCGHPSISQATSELLMAMTLQKVKMGAARPHYSEVEREKVQKELGLGIYSNKIFRCLNCNATPSKTVKLQLCGRCKSVWLCSPACMKAAWKKGHIQGCPDMGLEVGESSHLSTSSDSQKATLDEIVSRQGCALVALGESQEPRALIRDDATGRLFDSLSDEDVYFLPSDNALFKEVLRKKKLISMLDR